MTACRILFPRGPCRRLLKVCCPPRPTAHILVCSRAARTSTPLNLPGLTAEFLVQGFRVGVMRQIVDQSSADPSFTALFNFALGDMAAAGGPCSAAVSL